jgi:hypothetical protein
VIRVPVEAQLPPGRGARILVADVDVRVRVVATGREEPRLDQPAGVKALDPPATLREPDIAQPAPEQPALPARIRRHAERPQPPVDRRSVHPDPVIAAAQLVPPLQERRRAQPPHRSLPLARELRIGGAKAQHDPAGRTAAKRNRRVRVRHQLRDDLHQVDPALGEVLPEVAAVDAAVSDMRRVQRHDRRL